MNTRGPGRRLAAIALVGSLTGWVGCRPSDDGSHDREKIEAAKVNKVDAFKAAVKSKATKANSPVGEHWLVDLRGEAITDAQIKAIAEVGRVSTLDLSKSTITDGQLNELHALHGAGAFHKINLSHTAVSDAVLDWMADCPVLAELNLTGTKVTPAGVAKFKQKRKDSKNIRDMFRSVNVTTG